MIVEINTFQIWLISSVFFPAVTLIGFFIHCAISAEKAKLPSLYRSTTWRIIRFFVVLPLLVCLYPLVITVLFSQLSQVTPFTMYLHGQPTETRDQLLDRLLKSDSWLLLPVALLSTVGWFWGVIGLFIYISGS